MTTGQIIRMLRKERRISQLQLATSLSIGKSTVAMYEADERMPKKEILEQIADYFNVDMDFLYGRTHVRNRMNELPEGNGLFVPSMKRVPMLGSVACGEPIYADEQYGEYYSVDSSIHADFCLKARGDSMINARIYDGDIVFIHQQPDVENGQIAAVLIDDEATLKYFYRYGDMVVLRPANPAYKEMTYTKDELNSIRVLGRAVAFQSSL